MAASSDPRDKFDMSAPTDTWATFQKLAKWVVILCVILLIFMAMFLTGRPNVH